MCSGSSGLTRTQVGAFTCSSTTHPHRQMPADAEESLPSQGVLAWIQLYLKNTHQHRVTRGLQCCVLPGWHQARSAPMTRLCCSVRAKQREAHSHTRLAATLLTRAGLPDSC